MTKMLAVFLIILDSHAGFLPQSFTARLEQSYKSSLTGKIKRIHGTLDYKYPKKMRLKMESPENTLFVRNAQKSWYYTPPFIEGEQGSLTVKKSDGPERIFDLLNHGLSSNKFYSVKKKKNRYELTFSKEMAKKTDMINVHLDFSKANGFTDLKSISITYKNRPEVIIQLLKVKTGISFDKNHFKFTPPKNTRVNF